jgi:hypothetical protein
MSKNFQLQIGDCRFAINADVKIMNLETSSHINILRTVFNLKSTIANLKLFVEDIGFEPMTPSLQS